MVYRLLADGVMLLHLAFILWVVAGGVLVLRRPRLAWLHLPAVIWGAAVEFFGLICPLTPLEDHLRREAGAAGLQGGFIEHYLLPLIYPGELTRALQIVLGLAVLAINGAVYGVLLRRRRR